MEDYSERTYHGFTNDVDNLIQRYPNYHISEHWLITNPYRYLGIIHFDIFNDLYRTQHQKVINKQMTKFEKFIDQYPRYKILLKEELESQQATYKLWMEGSFEASKSNDYYEYLDFELEILFRRDDFEYILTGISKVNHLSMYPWLDFVIEEWISIDNALKPNLECLITQFRKAYPQYSSRYPPKRPVISYPEQFWWRTVENKIKNAEYERYIEKHNQS